MSTGQRILPCSRCETLGTGRFCTNCGIELPTESEEKGTETSDPGTLVNEWSLLRDAATDLLHQANEKADRMEEIAATLQTGFGIVLPRRDRGQTGSSSSAPGQLDPNFLAPDSLAVEPRPEPAVPTDEAPAGRSPGEKPKTQDTVVTTGPGGQGASAFDDAAPVNPERARAHARVVQRPLDTIEADHAGKTDPAVDEIRADTQPRGQEAPTDDPGIFQQNVAATLARHLQRTLKGG